MHCDALGDVVGAGGRVLTVDGHDPLVTQLAGQDPCLGLDLLEGEHTALHGGVVRAESAVQAAVHARLEQYSGANVTTRLS